MLDLKAYNDLHEHRNVPQKEGALGRWVSNQRHFYSKLARGEKTSLTDERVNVLSEVSTVDYRTDGIGTKCNGAS